MILKILAAVIVPYLVQSFYYVSFDISTWSPEGRFVCLVMGAALVSSIFMFHYLGGSKFQDVDLRRRGQ